MLPRVAGGRRVAADEGRVGLVRALGVSAREAGRWVVAPDDRVVLGAPGRPRRRRHLCARRTSEESEDAGPPGKAISNHDVG
jgi:hypothetical protein